MRRCSSSVGYRHLFAEVFLSFVLTRGVVIHELRQISCAPLLLIKVAWLLSFSFFSWAFARSFIDPFLLLFLWKFSHLLRGICMEIAKSHECTTRSQLSLTQGVWTEDNHDYNVIIDALKSERARQCRRLKPYTSKILRDVRSSVLSIMKASRGDAATAAVTAQWLEGLLATVMRETQEQEADALWSVKASLLETTTTPFDDHYSHDYHSVDEQGQDIADEARPRDILALFEDGWNDQDPLDDDHPRPDGNTAQLPPLASHQYLRDLYVTLIAVYDKCETASGKSDPSPFHRMLSVVQLCDENHLSLRSGDCVPLLERCFEECLREEWRSDHDGQHMREWSSSVELLGKGAERLVQLYDARGEPLLSVSVCNDNEQGEDNSGGVAKPKNIVSALIVRSLSHLENCRLSLRKLRNETTGGSTENESSLLDQLSSMVEDDTDAMRYDADADFDDFDDYHRRQVIKHLPLSCLDHRNCFLFSFSLCYAGYKAIFTLHSRFPVKSSYGLVVSLMWLC